jgi:(p)ppGpp synthase/HD superfamily hydrolase
MSNDEMILHQVMTFADNCHNEQMRRYTSDRYIVHPERVMKICREYTNDITVLSAALLHDVLEDTPVTKVEVKDFLSERMSEQQVNKTVQLIDELTDIYTKKNYLKWNRRKRKNEEADRLAKTSAEAQTIKYADIIDNAPEIAEKDPDFAKRFIPECTALLKRITKGNAELYNRAVNTVNNCTTSLSLKRAIHEKTPVKKKIW